MGCHYHYPCHIDLFLLAFERGKIPHITLHAINARLLHAVYTSLGIDLQGFVIKWKRDFLSYIPSRYECLYDLFDNWFDDANYKVHWIFCVVSTVPDEGDDRLEVLVIEVSDVIGDLRQFLL